LALPPLGAKSLDRKLAEGHALAGQVLRDGHLFRDLDEALD
jgi:hypothetical protein